MKKALPFIAAIVLAGVLLGAMYLLEQKPPEPAVQEEETAGAVPMVLTAVIEETHPPTCVSIAYNDQAATFIRQEDRYGVEGYDPRLTFDQDALANLFSSCTRLTSRKTVDVNPLDLATYGLDQPACTVTAQYADGAEHRIVIGARSPLDDGYYGRIDDQPAVQLLLSYDVDLFMKTLYDYRTCFLFHDLGNDAESYALTVEELFIEKASGERLRFQRQPAEADGRVYTIQIKEPATIGGDENAFYQKLIGPIFSLKNARLTLVEDSPSDLNRYGLDRPGIISLKDAGGETKLLVGRTENDRTYLMREDVPAVLSVKASALSFMNVDHAEVMDRLVWLFNIGDVSSVQILQQGASSVLTIHSGASFLLDGREIEAEAGRALYRSVISLLYEGRVEEAAQAEAECTLICTLEDGSVNTLALRRLNERHLEVVKDGVSTGFYCHQSALEEILAALEQANR